MEDSDLPQSARKRLKMENGHAEPSHAETEHLGNSTSGDLNQVPTEVMDLNETSPSNQPILDPNMPIQEDAYPDPSKEAALTPVSFQDASRSKELQVGIKELVNPGLPGFSGILKKRYTDFLVNEILPSGEVVRLDNLKPPKEPKEPNPRTQTETLASKYVSVAQVQDLPVDQPAPLESTQDDGVSSLRNESLSQNHGQEDLQVDTGLQETSDMVINSTSEPKSGTALAEASVLRTESKESLTDATQEELKANNSKNAFPEPNKNMNHWQAFAKEQPAFQLSTENSEILHSYFTPRIVTELLALFNRIVDSPHRKVKEYGIVNAGKVADREKRTKIHQDLRKIFSSRLESATDENGAIVITASVMTGSMDSRNDRDSRGQGRGRDRGRGRGGHGGHDAGFKREQRPRRLNWQELGGDYLHFTIYKENKDTMEVIGYLTRQLHMKPQGFQFAGTKDRRAITVQRASVYRVRAEQLASVGRTLRYSYIGNFQHQKQGLDLGDLLGNEFIITLRDCQFVGLAGKDSDEKLQLAQKIAQDTAQHLSDEGFINYYGLQRFGTFATRTDAIGLKMLQGDFKGAVAAILEFPPSALAAAKDPMTSDTTISSEDKARAWAIDNFQVTGKGRPALDELPRKFSAEASLIRHLSNPRNRNDFRGALQLIPRNLRLMYVHAYQSLVWNLAASERWARFGKEVTEGDLVLINNLKDKDDHDDTIEAGEELDSEGGVIVRPAAHDASRSEEDRFERARTLTAEEANSGEYTIFDIVLPTPGFDVLYPANKVGEFYANYMKSEVGGNLDPNDMRRAWKDVSLSGNYRKLVARPLKAVEIEVKSYMNENEQFVETDMERLEKKKRSKEGQPVNGATAGRDGTVTKNEGDSGETASAAAAEFNITDLVSTKPIDASDQGLNSGIDQPMPDVDLKKGVPGEEHENPSASATQILPSDVKGEAPVGKVAVPEQDEATVSPKIAVILKLQLGSSQYATMALRELMKEGGVRIYKPDFGTGRR